MPHDPRCTRHRCTRKRAGCTLTSHGPQSRPPATIRAHGAIRVTGEGQQDDGTPPRAAVCGVRSRAGRDCSTPGRCAPPSQAARLSHALHRLTRGSSSQGGGCPPRGTPPISSAEARRLTQGGRQPACARGAEARARVGRTAPPGERHKAPARCGAAEAARASAPRHLRRPRARTAPPRPLQPAPLLLRLHPEVGRPPSQTPSPPNRRR
jgi:hypothetical protein